MSENEKCWTIINYPDDANVDEKSFIIKLIIFFIIITIHGKWQDFFLLQTTM